MFFHGRAEGFDVLSGCQAVEVAAEAVDFFEVIFVDEPFFLTGSGFGDVDGRVDAAIG